MDMNTAVSLLNIKEDLLDDGITSLESTQPVNQSSTKVMTEKIKPTKGKSKSDLSAFERLITMAVKQLGCNKNEITSWLNKTPNAPEAVKLNALRLITKHGLDPFADEIAIYQYEDAHWQAFITIDGWSKLINSHPAFSGISFTESEELINGVPAWMGCAIYRNDRVVPIEVKEYLCEIQTEHSIWKDMPRRMLRHRVIAQCARLAFAITAPEVKNKINNQKNNPKKSHITKQVGSNIRQIDKLKAYMTKPTK